MEINNILGDVKAVVAKNNIVEGRMVTLQAHTLSADFGSLVDLPGVDTPSTADEAKKARFVVTFPVTYQKPPIYVNPPSMAYALRGGFDQADNSDFTAVVETTFPGYKESKTIPSGTLARAFGAGTFTIPSGQYIASANLVPGASLSVAYTPAADRGKLQYQATYDADLVVGFVMLVDPNTQNLTVTLKEF